LEGTLISDRYRLIRLLGKGGMGSVWLAEHTNLKNQVAVKLIDSELGKLAQPRARFLREAQLAARIKSSHVVQVHDHGLTSDGQPYIAMEYLVGESLRDRLAARQRLTAAETARVVSHVCRALSRAHEAGLVHRDLKPENIFIAQDDDGEVIKILDFGVAKAADALSDSGIDPTRTGALLGTPFYMSPEQAQGLKTVDLRTDLWALGVVVFECLTGERQFSAEALGPLIGKILAAPIRLPSQTPSGAGLPPEVDAWVARALERDPAKRFASAREMSESFMIASGSADSFGRDRSTRDVGGSQVEADGEAGGAVPDSTEVALGRTVPVEAAPAPIQPIPQAAVRTHDPSAPSAEKALAEKAPSRLPWVVAVVVLGLVVAGLGTLLVLRH
jgi:serine/threonine protein kinase